MGEAGRCHRLVPQLLERNALDLGDIGFSPLILLWQHGRLQQKMTERINYYILSVKYLQEIFTKIIDCLVSSDLAPNSNCCIINVKQWSIIIYTYIRIHFQMQDPIALNEEISQKYESYSNTKPNETGTLDEPVLDTIKRDLNMIKDKIMITLSGDGDYASLEKQWDLWGPLVISLVTAGLAAFSTKDTEEAFTSIFISLWVGPLLITVNSRLLGSKIPIIQTLCLIVYCSSPIMVLSFLVFLFNIIIRSFFINILLAGAALVFTLRSNLKYFQRLNTPDKQLLSLYPVLLFYVFICLFISMI